MWCVVYLEAAARIPIFLVVGGCQWSMNFKDAFSKSLISSSQCRADVLVTDLPEFVDLMRTNVQMNSSTLTGCVTATELTW